LSKKPQTVKEALVAARNFLIRHKWGKGEFHDPITGAYCALGALSVVTWDAEYEYYIGAHRALNACVPAMEFHGATPIVYLNDLESTKKKDIIAVYDCAIASLA